MVLEFFSNFFDVILLLLVTLWLWSTPCKATPRRSYREMRIHGMTQFEHSMV